MDTTDQRADTHLVPSWRVVLLRSFVIALGLCIALAASGARAQDEEAARRHFAAGEAYFGTADYENALREFRSAYASSPRPQLLYNIYVCEERLAHLEPALSALEEFLASDAIEAHGEDRSRLEARLATLRDRVAQDATVPPPAVPTSDAGTSSFDPTLSIIGFAVGGAGAILAIVFGALSAVEDQRLFTLCDRSCSDAQVADLNTFTIVADVGLGVLVAGATAGIVGLFTGQQSSPARASALRVVPGGFSWRF